MVRRILFVLALCMTLLAEGSPRPATDSVRRARYVRALNQYALLPEVVAYSDSMLMLAQEFNNVRDQCIAYNQKSSDYSVNSLIDSAQMMVDAIHPLAQKHNMPEFYFSSWSNLIRCSLRKLHIMEALRELEKFRSEAEAWPYHYAVGTYHTLLGDLYYMQDRYGVALDAFVKADSIFNALGEWANDVYVKQMCSQCLTDQGNYAQADSCYRVALKLVLDNPDVVPQQYIPCLKLDWGLCRYHMGDTQQARRNFEEVDIPPSQLPYPSQSAYYELKSYLLADSGNFGEALSVTDSIIYMRYCCKARETIYAQLGRYDKAYAVSQERLAMDRKVYNDVSRVYNDQLEVMAQIERADANREIRSQRIILALISALLLVTVIFFFFDFRRRRKSMRRIEAQRLIAEQARQDALAADNLKNEFIRGLSSEIVAPLNTIIGFSQLLRSRAHDEEDIEFSKIIDENSASLRSLIDDILDLSNLTSNNYQVSNVQVLVEDVCNLVAKEAEAHLPHGVTTQIIPSDSASGLTIYTDIKRLKQVLLSYVMMGAGRLQQGTVALSYALTADDKIRFTVTFAGDRALANVIGRMLSGERKDLAGDEIGGTTGFSICRIIAEYLFGRCYVDMECSDSVRLVFELPLLPPSSRS